MLSDAAAREVLRSVWVKAAGCPADDNSLTVAGAIGRSEGQYGAAFGGINNWGAIQTAHPSGNDVQIDEYNPNRNPPEIRAWVKAYATPADGAYALLRELVRRKGVQAAMKRGDWAGTATAMYDSGYYTTRSKDRATAISQYTGWIKSAGDKIIAAIGIPIRAAAGRGGALAIVIAFLGLSLTAAYLNRRATT